LAKELPQGLDIAMMSLQSRNFTPVLAKQIFFEYASSQLQNEQATRRSDAKSKNE
jgi:hypothetical protein